MHSTATNVCEARAETADPVIDSRGISNRFSVRLMTVAVAVMNARVFILPDAVRRVL